MTNTTLKDTNIPNAVRIFTIFLICAGTFFAFVFITNPGLAFPGAKITDYSSKLGFYSTGVRVIGSVIALMLCLYFNSAKFLFITLISRIVIEIGDIITGFATGGTMTNNLMIGVIAALEIWAVCQLWKSIKS